MQNLFKTPRKTAAIIAYNKKPVYQCLPFFYRQSKRFGQLFGFWQLNPEFQTYSCSMINIVVRHLACLLHEQHCCETPCLSLTWTTLLWDTLPVSYMNNIVVRHPACLLPDQHRCETHCQSLTWSKYLWDLGISLTWSTWLRDTLSMSYMIKLIYYATPF